MKNYTAAQTQAIESDSNRILVIAGPGSGKTQTSVERVKRLIHGGVYAGKICAITFTNAAAREFEKRTINALREIYGCTTDGNFVTGYCGTLHGFALRCLKKYGHTWGYGERIAIIDEEATAELIMSKAKSLGCKSKLADLLEIKTKGLSKERRQLTPAELVIAGYYEDLREAGIVDFDSLLSEFLILLQKDKTAAGAILTEFSHLFVDEVQDSAEIDWQIYDALSIENKFFVGDPDQAIYSFRGGRVEELMKRSRKGYEVISLQENFRSHSEVCDAANKLIAHNNNRIFKKTLSSSGKGGFVGTLAIAENEGAEIAGVSNAIKFLTTRHDHIGEPDEPPFSEIAILARTNAICSAYRNALKATGIPVDEPARIKKPRDWAYARSIVELLVNPENDTLAYFFLIARGIHKGNLNESIARADAHKWRQGAALSGISINQYTLKLTKIKAVQVPAALTGMGISRESYMSVVELLKQLPQDAAMVDLALAMGREGEITESKKQGVMITTMHGAKGLEFDVVFIVGAEEEICPGKRKTQTAADIEEERRLFFVAVTRARKALYIAHAASRVTPWREIQQHFPSRFLKELLP